MAAFRNLPINRKLAVAILGTTGAALLLACGAFVTYELATFKEAMVRSMTLVADGVGTASTAMLAFEQKDEAEGTLRALRGQPGIVAASLYDKSNAFFAGYASSDATPTFPSRPEVDGATFAGGYLTLFRPVTLDGKRIGTVYLKASTADVSARLWSYLGISFLVLVGSFLLALVLSSWLRRLIAGPILSLAEVASRVSATRDYSMRARKESEDELGSLTDAFNRMLGAIEERTSALQKANEALHTQRMQILEGVTVLGSSGSAILAATSQLSAGANEAASAVIQTTTTVEQVRHTARVSSETAKRVAETAQQAVRISLEGKKATEATATGMEGIRAQMEAIAGSMLRLSAQSQAIGEIITSVDELAQQSNLLSVNASIEAAKAGEQGKGFGVVAQEVKLLAEQSKEATKRVRSLLGDIQKATGEAVLATEQGTRAVESGVTQAKAAGASIAYLADNIAAAEQAAMQIATTSQQQYVGMEQVTAAMASIKVTSGQAVTSTQQAETAAQQLNDLGQRLRDLAAD
jgi:methyl-accepting chemotaxis protein